MEPGKVRTLAVVVTDFIVLDSESNRLGGAMHCGVYVIATLAFLFAVK